MKETFLWVEKYRPKTIQDCVLPANMKKTFSEFVKKGIPNLLLTGGAGVGKTTVAKAMLDEIGYDYILINGSEESGIDVLRNKMKNFASTMSLEGSRKFIIIDEADYLNPQSTQPALRGMIEEFHKNCGFILTCNFKNRIIDPLHSRCSVVEFNIPANEKPTLAQEFMSSVENVLTTENVKFDKRVIQELIIKFFPDWRRCLNELQRYSASGQIDGGILVNLSEKNMKDLILFMKEKDFKSVRKWCVNNLDNDPTRIFRKIYDNLYNYFDGGHSIATSVLILADYQYKSAFVADQEINLLACLTQIMGECKFK
jgi:replication factor C small subunit